MMMLWIVLLFAAGAILIFAEFFIPGMVLGAIGACCLAASAVLAIMNYPDHAFLIVTLEVFGIAAVIMFGMYLLPRSRVGRALILHDSQQPEEGYVAADGDVSLVGSLAEVITPLRPAGTIRVNDRRLTAVSRGDFIEEGAMVRITEVQGNRVVVEAAQDAQQHESAL
jgi:membrane-bound serine protease (ClpP class)